MFALCLRVDKYATDHTLLGSDLSLATDKYVATSPSLSSVPILSLRMNMLFKSLGESFGHRVKCLLVIEVGFVCRLQAHEAE